MAIAPIPSISTKPPNRVKEETPNPIVDSINNTNGIPVALAEAPKNFKDMTFDFNPKPFKDYVVKLMEDTQYTLVKPDPGDGYRENAITSPEIIQGFEKLIVQHMLPFYKKILEAKTEHNLDPNEEMARIGLRIDTHFRDEKHSLDKFNFDLRSYYPSGELSKSNKSLRDMALEFSLIPYRNVGLRAPINLPDITIVDEKEPLVKTAYTTKKLKPIRRVIMTFHDPDNPGAVLEVTYNAGKWLCGRDSCPRELQIVEKKVSGMDKLENIAYKRFIDPKQNKYRNSLWTKLRGPYPAPASLAA
jgi:hypothetical protein